MAKSLNVAAGDRVTIRRHKVLMGKQGIVSRRLERRNPSKGIPHTMWEVAIRNEAGKYDLHPLAVNQLINGWVDEAAKV